VAAFDQDPEKIGKDLEGIPVHDIDRVEEVSRRESIQMALITVPAAAAQDVADRLVRAGVRALLNFAPVRLKLLENVTVHNIDVALELERLSFLNTHSRGSSHG
jgi:redox-sensing transcriptional repressor